MPNLKNMKNINRQQKYVLSITFNKGTIDQTRHLFNSNKTLNTYQLIILNSLIFMHKTEWKNNEKTAPNVFLLNLHKPIHIYPTRYSNLIYQKLISKLKVCKYMTSIRGLYLSYISISLPNSNTETN